MSDIACVERVCECVVQRSHIRTVDWLICTTSKTTQAPIRMLQYKVFVHTFSHERRIGFTIHKKKENGQYIYFVLFWLRTFGIAAVAAKKKSIKKLRKKRFTRGLRNAVNVKFKL